jgi:hypothetical protein
VTEVVNFLTKRQTSHTLIAGFFKGRDMRIQNSSLALLFLAGCSGGGGGSSGGGQAGQVGQSSIPGQLFLVSNVNPATGEIGAFFTPASGSFSRTRDPEPDGPTVDRITADGTSLVADNGSATDFEVVDGRISAFFDGDSTGGVEALLDESFEFVRYAGWAQFEGAIGAGGETPSVTSPIIFAVWGEPTTSGGTSGLASATYSGRSVGIVSADEGSVLPRGWLTSSDVTVTTDFANISVQSSNTIRENGENTSGTAASELDFLTSGTVSGVGYTASGDGMQINGAFYGPNAEETGGTFGGTRNGQNYGGVFGGAR